MRNELSKILGLGAALLLAGGCVLSFPAEDSANKFACATNSDCLSGYTCVGGFCASGGGSGTGGDTGGSGGDGNTQNLPVLTVTLSGSATGTVTSDPPGINCPTTCSATYLPATSVTLTAAPANPAFVTTFAGACAAAPCTVVMNGDRSVNVSFQVVQDIVNLVVGAGRVTSGTQAFDVQIGGPLEQAKTASPANELEGASNIHPATQR